LGFFLCLGIGRYPKNAGAIFRIVAVTRKIYYIYKKRQAKL